MTSERPTEAFVWVWLPEATQPVVAGRLNALDEIVVFQYGASYLDRDDAVPLYLPELPLRRGVLPPDHGLRIAGCIADAGPDSWGQRVILDRLASTMDEDALYDDLGPLGFLLESGSDRFGALDFQGSSDAYVARSTQQAALEDLQEAAMRVDEGLPIDPTLAQALLHASSIGGARPKVLLRSEDGRAQIAKFARRSDPYPVVGAEGAAMWLASQVGIEAASVEVQRCGNSDVLLVDRFDRPAPNQRSMVMSALTLQGLDAQLSGRYATYTALAHDIRTRFTKPNPTLRELFARIAFNICVGNTDDHARNHAAFWDGHAEMLTLSPAFDICPQTRSGGEATQAMAFDVTGNDKRARLSALVDASSLYHLDRVDAEELVTEMVATIRRLWSDAADFARLNATDRALLFGAQILNKSIFY